MHEINQGVHCDVKNCHYHDQHDHCTADVIHVGPTNADCCQATECATFKKR
ncbi:DUF1540 domain-containing protein [Feifania hominis]|uniref:DUF1540 domain-containing protein n=1 Tax=Feifania hominis TaxID=2763660 RepID=A0A926DD21_9FIRM|nr:DUF1540 domain-containing protein [Feifania hominis]MBC8535602.1 DUF1540 domain-containing protein [Feifania hominis]